MRIRATTIAAATLTVITACGSGNTSTSPAEAAADAGQITADAAPTEAGAGVRVRLMAANLTSGTHQAYETPGIHIFQGLLPDIVMIQEFNYAAGDLRALVDTAFGTSFSFFVEPRSGGIPNGVVSRYPILESGVWVDASVSDRAFVYARIDVPGPVDLWAVSVHLLTTGATQRATEATQLTAAIQGKIPATDYLVIGGDFNTASASEPAMSDFAPVVVVTPPYPADQSGNPNSSINRDHPHDWVLANSSLGALETPVTIGAASFASGLVFDSRVYTPLSNVPPILQTDSAATGMQHMPVVRDFLLR